MLDQHDFLPGYFLKFEDRLEMTEESLRFLHLGSVNDEELVAVNHQICEKVALFGCEYGIPLPTAAAGKG
jgi:hypothetical protein